MATTETVRVPSTRGMPEWPIRHRTDPQEGEGTTIID